jgi:hypothetical protein
VLAVVENPGVGPDTVTDRELRITKPLEAVVVVVGTVLGAAGGEPIGGIGRPAIATNSSALSTPPKLPNALKHAITMLTAPTAVTIPGRPCGGGVEYISG